jgi:2-enoate reductase
MIPDIDGIEQGNVVTAVDAMLDMATLGENIVIVGTGLVGVETALYLSTRGKKITLVEMADKLLPEPVFYMNEAMLINMISCTDNISAITGATLKLITKDSVCVEVNSEHKTIACDTVVLATGFSNDETLTGEFGNAKVFTIGDCKSPRQVIDAISEARIAINSLS